MRKRRISSKLCAVAIRLDGISWFYRSARNFVIVTSRFSCLRCVIIQYLEVATVISNELILCITHSLRFWSGHRNLIAILSLLAHFFQYSTGMAKTVEQLSIALHHGIHADEQLYRLKRGTILRLVPGPSLLGRSVALYCNYPATGKSLIEIGAPFIFHLSTIYVSDKAEFTRNQFSPLNWFNRDGKKLSDDSHPYAVITDLETHCEIEVNRAGTFYFYFNYEDEYDWACCSGLSSQNLILLFYSSNEDKHQGSLYVQVEPKIRVGAQKTAKVLPLDSIRCQTVLAKLLGPLSTWEKKLIVAKNSGYNLIHFTPIQVPFDYNPVPINEAQLKIFIRSNWECLDHVTRWVINSKSIQILRKLLLQRQRERNQRFHLMMSIELLRKWEMNGA